MTLKATADLLGVHVNTIANWIRSGELRSVPVGSFRRPLKADVLRRAYDQAQAMAATVTPDALDAMAGDLERYAARLRQAAATMRD